MDREFRILRAESEFRFRRNGLEEDVKLQKNKSLAISFSGIFEKLNVIKSE